MRNPRDVGHHTQKPGSGGHVRSKALGSGGFARPKRFGCGSYANLSARPKVLRPINSCQTQTHNK